MVAIGKFKERIVIQNYTESKDSYGQMIRTYSTLYTLWAQYQPSGGSESFEAREKTAKRFATFRIRYQGITIDETMRVIWNGYTFDIQSIEQTDFRDHYTLRCISKDNV